MKSEKAIYASYGVALLLMTVCIIILQVQMRKTKAALCCFIEATENAEKTETPEPKKPCNCKKESKEQASSN